MRLPDTEEINLVCPICGKEFTRTDDTKYITHGAYTCSWECFLKTIKGNTGKENIINKKGKQDGIVL